MLESPALLERIDLLAARTLDGAEAQGYAVGVSDGDGNRVIRTYGYRNRDAGLPVDEQTLFEIGSISKSALAIVCMQLVAEGRLDLHAPVTEYLPWFAVDSHYPPITPHDLLCHTAGLPSGHTHRPHGLHEVWELRRVRPYAAPGDAWNYSNVGYDALGLMVERLLEQPFGQFMQERVLDPAGLTQSYATITSEMRPKLAVGYQWRFDDRPPLPQHGVVPATWVETAVGSGSIAMTASDLLAYAELLRAVWHGADTPVLTSTQLHTMLDRAAMPAAAQAASYGYGLAWALDPDDPGTLLGFGHGGGMVGFITDLWIDLRHDLCFAELANGHVATADVPDRIRDAVSDLHAGDPIAPLPPGRDRFDLTAAAELSGRWRSEARDIELVANGSTLELIDNGERTSLQWLSPRSDRWLMVDRPDWALFALEIVRDDPGEDGSSGPVTKLHHGGETFRRAEADSVPEPGYPAEWNAFVGHYRSYNPWESSKRVVLREGQLRLIERGSERGMDAGLLVPQGDGFRVGAESPNPDWLTFDAIVDGRAFILRFETGAEYSRFFAE